MLFTPHVKRKKGVNHKLLELPVPSCIPEQPCNAVFTGISVEICDAVHIKNIYENGFYGKGSGSRGAPAIITQAFTDSGSHKADETLTLDLEEACFLSYFHNIININSLEDKPMTWQQFIEAAERINPNFIESLAAYLYLKAKGWVVKNGIKFGGNFLLYKKGPRYYHASFIVIIRYTNAAQQIPAKDIKGLQRVAETSDKDVLFLEIIKPDDFTLNTLTDIKAISVTETVVRRFNSSAFVQNQNITI